MPSSDHALRRVSTFPESRYARMRSCWVGIFLDIKKGLIGLGGGKTVEPTVVKFPTVTPKPIKPHHHSFPLTTSGFFAGSTFRDSDSSP